MRTGQGGGWRSFPVLGTFVPGTVLGALTKRAMTLQIGDCTVPILEMRELRPREDACSRPHPQERRTGIQARIWGAPEAPCLSGRLESGLSRNPHQALTHVLPSSRVAKDPVLKHEVPL